MSRLDNIREVYLIGIGGIGMSGLARYFAKRGCSVSGYDRTPTELTAQLESEGIAISYADDAGTIPAEFERVDEQRLVIYTPAIPADSKIRNYLQHLGHRLYKRSEVLGIISRGMFTIAVAGTHGKTTTSCMVAHLLRHAGNRCSAFLGGIATNYNSNVLFGDNEVMVVEADEYDRSFLTLHPDIAIVTSMDADHLDIYGDPEHLGESFRQFASQLKPGGTLIRQELLELEGGLSYSVMKRADVMASNIRVDDGCFVFDYSDGRVELKDLKLWLPGSHNVSNMTAAVKAALLAGVEPGQIAAGVASFKGVKRRFEYIVRTPEHVFIDDYAHHPEELRACLSAVRMLYPNRKLTAVFQPHLYSRTRDFAEGFAEVLGMADDLLLLDIYPARELPIEGVDSEMILSRVALDEKQKCGKEEALEYIRNEKPGLILTLGAGDIDTLVKPIKTILEDA